MTEIAALRCITCNSAEIVCVDPGAEETRELFLLARGRPVRAWCLECWVGMVKA